MKNFKSTLDGLAAVIQFSDAKAAQAELPEITEHSCSLQFERQYANELRFNHTRKRWTVWAGSHWRPEATDLAFNYARSVTLVANGPAKTHRAPFFGGVERIARSARCFAVEQADFDRDPWLLATPGGTVDLKTGQLRKAEPTNMISKVTAATPTEAAECPLFLDFIDEVTCGDDDLARFLQQWFGYSLTGITTEQKLAFFYGTGANGKSLLLSTVRAIVGDYGVTCPMDTFVSSKNDRHPTELAMLAGARLAISSETEEGRQWAESRVKDLTGGERISARFMRADFFEFTPILKLTCFGNHKPNLNNVDTAMRRRIIVVPFNLTLAPEERDAHLGESLMGEAPGILQWMIRGCLDWQQNGLIIPAAVQTETDSYFSEQDTIRQWGEDRCTIDLKSPHLFATSAALFKSWSDYLQSRGEPTETVQRFGERLRGLGLQSEKIPGGQRGWRHITLKVPPPIQRYDRADDDDYDAIP